MSLARDRGIAVTILGRAPTGCAFDAGARSIPWRLNEPVPDSAFTPFGSAGRPTALIHLAHDWAADCDLARAPINVDGLARILTATRRAGPIRVVMASSQSARPDALNQYGRAKQAAEQLLRLPAESAVRLGLVYGGAWRGPVGTLDRLLRTLPIVPVIAPRTLLFPIHVDDAANGLLTIAAAPHAGPAVLAGAPITFLAFCRALRDARGGGCIVRVPLSPVAARIVARGLPAFLAERLLGLIALPLFETKDQAPLILRTLEEGLSPDRTRRERLQLLREGYALLRYVLRATPDTGMLRRYVRAVTRHDGGRPLDVSPVLLRIPSALRFAEPLTRDSRLAQRLDIGLAIADASPQGFAHFYKSENRFIALGRLPFLLLAEALLTLPRWLLRCR